MQQLRSGAEARVILDFAAGIATKTFDSNEVKDVSDRAHREYQALTLLHTALAKHPHIDCPKPVTWRESGSIDMTIVSGVPLEAVFRDRLDCEDSYFSTLGVMLGTSLLVMLDALPSPPLDFSPRNVLVTPGERQMFLLDVGQVEDDVDEAGYQFGIGAPSRLVQAASWFIHCCVYSSTMLRPPNVLSRRQWHVRRLTLKSMLDVLRLQSADERLWLEEDCIRRHWALASFRRRPKSFVWLRTFGFLLFVARLRQILRESS